MLFTAVHLEDVEEKSVYTAVFYTLSFITRSAIEHLRFNGIPRNRIPK